MKKIAISLAAGAFFQLSAHNSSQLLLQARAAIKKNSPSMVKHITKLAIPVARSYVAATQQEHDSVYVKPEWALRHLPNGVPRELARLVDFLQNPEKFTRLGAKMPRGFLLYGPPGTGKTSIARAIAEAVNAEFIAKAGTDFTAHLHGKGAEMVRELFKDAKKKAARRGKAMIFIDEAEIIFPLAGSRAEDSGKEQRTAFLTELDGYERLENVYVFAATNRINAIDYAIKRSGRLESHIFIPLPDEAGRADILRHYIKSIKIKNTEGLDILPELVSKTEGMSGADLQKLINDAAIRAAGEDAVEVANHHILAVLGKYHRGSPENNQPS